MLHSGVHGGNFSISEILLIKLIVVKLCLVYLRPDVILDTFPRCRLVGWINLLTLCLSSTLVNVPLIHCPL